MFARYFNHLPDELVKDILEDDIDSYSFRLPKDSYQLCEIGTVLHNCVANYGEGVRKKECTIVYTQKDGQYKICIEVRGKKIVQKRIDRNESPGEEENSVLEKWHERPYQGRRLPLCL